MRVDVHAHMLPIECLREMQRLAPEVAPKFGPDPATGKEMGSIDGKPFGPFGPGMYDPEARLREYRAWGIELQALSPIPFAFYYWLEPELGATFALLQNDAIAEVARAYPREVVGLATVPLQDPVRAVAGAERMRKYFLANMVGNPLDTTIAIASLVFGGMVARHPRLKLTFAHGGGFAPYQWGRFDHGWGHRANARGVIERPPSDYLKRLHFDALLFNPEAVAYLVRSFGAEHVLLGTDYPFEMRPDDPVGSIEAVPGLSRAEREAILGGNALRLLAN